jgi:DNA-binding response OmpR family regulator
LDKILGNAWTRRRQAALASANARLWLAPEAKRVKILVIDNDVLLRRTVARILTADGHEVLTAPDGTRGMVLFHQVQPELIITDLVMPGGDGIETILMVRRTDAPTRIIAISGQNAEMLETALLIGADEAIQKPFRAAELVDRVRALGAAPCA